MNLSVKIAYNSTVQILGRAASGFINLLVILLLTREFGQATWADYVTITSYIAIFTLIGDFGLNAILVREVVEKPDQRNHYFQSLLTLRLGLAAVAIFLAMAIMSFTGHSSLVKFGIILGIFAVLAQSLTYSANSIFQLLLKFDRGVLADVGGSFFMLVLVGALSTTNAGIIPIVVVYLVSNFLKAALSLFFVRNYVKLGLSFDRNYWKHLIFLSWPLGLTAIFSQITANIDKQIVALASYKPSLGQTATEAVANYGLAYRLFDFAIALPTFIVNSAFPALVEKKKNDFPSLKNFVVRLCLSMAAISFLGGLVAIVLSGYFLPIFGDYGEALTSIRILFLGLPLFFVSALGFGIFIVMKKQLWLPFIYGFAAIFNFTANYYFVPRFGYNAAAVITLATEVVILLPMAFLLLGFWGKEDESY